MKFKAFLAATLLALQFSPAVEAAVSQHVVVSFDNVYYSAFKNGDKGQGCTLPPSGFTALSLGGGGGIICDSGSSALAFTVFGINNLTDNQLIYKDAGSGEVQVEGKINNDYAGSSEAFAAVGGGIRESILSTSWLAQCQSLQAGTTAIQCQYGAAGVYTTVNCPASGATRAAWFALTSYPTNDEVKGFTSADGATWDPCFSTIRHLSGAFAYALGGSKSAITSLTATMSSFAVLGEIDAYNELPIGGSAPQIVPPGIPDQTANQGVALSSLCVGAYFTGETGFNAATGLPGGTGITFSTGTGCFSGTPTASDVGAKPITVTATNASGATPDTFTLTTAAVPGDLVTVSSSQGTDAAILDCNTFSGGVGPGDVLVLASGTRSRLNIRNCHGNAQSPIVLRNDILAGAPTVIEWATGASTYLLRCENCTYFEIDGTGGYSGSSGTCGTTAPGLTKNSSACGIQMRTDADGAPAPQAWVKFKGHSSNYKIKGIYINGSTSNAASDSSVGFDCNDHQINNTFNLPVNQGGDAGTLPYTGEWREDIEIANNYIFKNGNTTANGGNGTGEGMYCGSNGGDDDLPMRNVNIHNNYGEGSPRECINGKYWRGGTNYVHDNWVKDCAAQGSAGQQRGINITDGGDVLIYNNVVDNPNGMGIAVQMNGSADTTDPGEHASPYNATIFNNVIWSASSSGIQIKSAQQQPPDDQISPVLIYHNTIVDSVVSAIVRDVYSGTCTARDNIFAGSAAAQSQTGGCTSTSNTLIPTANFGTNFANPGAVTKAASDYELISTSTACNAGTSNTTPSTDYEGETRPEAGTNSDDGADEATACP